ncbi:hypothetical protein pb186bvf_000439 [Paramecium bursaria]
MSYTPFSNLAYCPKQVIEFIQRPHFSMEDLEKITLKLPKNHRKSLQRMQLLVSRQEQFIMNTEDTLNIRGQMEEDPVSPKRILKY